MSRLSRSLSHLVPRRFRAERSVVPVVQLTGVIGFSTPMRPGLTLASAANSLERAFSVRDAKAVALLINSPGGSAVQSHLIFSRIRALAEEKKLPVIAVAEDVAASGGYMIACAADTIVADSSSLVGSIGVMGGSFGFHRLLDKIGVERRLYTSGERKAMLDPFLPERPEDVERLKAIQREIHESFIALVQSRRGSKLAGDEAALFSGEYWTGHRAKALGLVDEIGDLRSVLRARFGDKVETPLMVERGWFSRRPMGIGGGRTLLDFSQASFAEDALSTLEARALWARYGL